MTRSHPAEDAPDAPLLPEAPAEGEPDLPDREFGRWLFAQQCGFVAGVQTMAQLPEFALPEVAFAGRSNVGKSSLVNALTGQNTLARTSNTPGRTRQLNFFDLGSRLLLVDLPGYGYAKAPKTEIKRWTELTQDYLRGRPTLRRVCLLVDARRGVRDTDREVMTALDTAAVSYQLVLTKADKVKQPELAQVLETMQKLHPKHVALHPRIATTSAQKDTGIAELRAELAALASDRPYEEG
ncbi:ribosome biogenesis GTP-binding protein YihA/YsxC [Rhodovibrio salinarum]|uniref:Probable GTP-binding protein EngB n=1 Tax=Rhodovibrio salinarum TaxID=1087 RepID=A0A934QH71_9PROT|nr:ribosome biogenesis GTP-binding protein YihA/YsxC [Rhodovibrio salinarum]MBK1696723.1 YihA family ribosome biogenesis GTP-binding protein [Rhodovibrio salinarum]